MKMADAPEDAGEAPSVFFFTFAKAFKDGCKLRVGRFAGRLRERGRSGRLCLYFSDQRESLVTAFRDDLGESPFHGFAGLLVENGAVGFGRVVPVSAAPPKDKIKEVWSDFEDVELNGYGRPWVLALDRRAVDQSHRLVKEQIGRRRARGESREISSR